MTRWCPNEYTKKALPKEEALRIMKEGRGTQFDPDVLDAFLEVVE